MTDQTQKSAILAYVKQHHFITRMDAFKHCATCNLWARITELEDDGHKFDRRRVKLRSGKYVLQYWLRRGKQARAA
jgi:hypothetical protein